MSVVIALLVMWLVSCAWLSVSSRQWTCIVHVGLLNIIMVHVVVWTRASSEVVFGQSSLFVVLATCMWYPMYLCSHTICCRWLWDK